MVYMLFGLNIEELIFVFFLFSFMGWVFELFLEWLAGRGFVNRGFFYGPIVPIYAAGFFFAYLVCHPLRNYPVLIFFVSSAACTLLEYFAGWFLQKYLHVEAWNYDLHPFTFWCNYKKRIALTASVTFGFLSLLVVYYLWDLMLGFLHFMGPELIVILDRIFVIAFLIDACFSFGKYLKNKKAGIYSKTKGLDYDLDQDNDFFTSATEDILLNDTFLESRKFIQHGKISVYEHSLAVAKMCATLSLFWKVKDRDSMIRAALLHDFFLYDWHDEWPLDHGFTHPAAAAENAKKIFNISEKEYSLISTHMWPFTLLHPPKHKEGWFICICDKIVSLSEILKQATSNKQQATSNKQQATSNKQQATTVDYSQNYFFVKPLSHDLSKNALKIRFLVIRRPVRYFQFCICGHHSVKRKIFIMNGLGFGKTPEERQAS